VKAACSFPGCGRSAKSKGLCNGHYAQRLRGQELTPLQRRIPGDLCSFEGCTREHYAKGLCSAHHRQTVSGKAPTALLPKRRRVASACIFPGCERDHATGGYCAGHRGQMRRGVPLKPLRSDTLRDFLIAELGTRTQGPECWTDWPGYNDATGRPKLWDAEFGGVLAYRLAYFLTHGEWPNFACHRCPNHEFGEDPRCWNPAHIYSGDAATNAADYARHLDARKAAK